MFNNKLIEIPLSFDIREYIEGKKYKGKIKINQCEFSFEFTFLFNIKRAELSYLSILLPPKLELSSYLMEIEIDGREVLIGVEDKVFISRFLAYLTGRFQHQRSYLGEYVSGPVLSSGDDKDFHPRELAIALNKKPFSCGIEL